ncbi:MAG: ATP-binding protein [Cyclobacteriaceae bacterium]|nr:ATP-binding protein [Cyclobacteriaceae bacterium]
MEFKSFSFLLWARIILLLAVCIIAVVSFTVWAMYPVTLFFTIIIIIQCFNLHHFLNTSNRKLSHFLDSVQYSDFVTTFSVDNKLGTTFKGLNKSFNNVLEAFRKARKEKEEHLQYLNLVVEHVDTGLISFDDKGKVDVVNNIALHLLNVPKINHMDALKVKNKALYDTIWNLKIGEKTMFVVRENIHLSIRATQFVRRGQFIKLIALHNIHSELAKNELDAWQNLLSVLRHEIMNSMTPISSLSSTMKSILDEDLIKKDNLYELNESVMNDLTESLDTISSRSKGLITFIQGYRDYTSLPTPIMATVNVCNLINQVGQLMKQETSVEIQIHCTPKTLEIVADEHLIEQVLINLVKNAKEAIRKEIESPLIKINAYKQHQFTIIEVEDNGLGIVPEAIDKIFIPFYTNKKSGSGIGLSISKQIINLHNGSLQVMSEPEVKTIFRLVF